MEKETFSKKKPELSLSEKARLQEYRITVRDETDDNIILAIEHAEDEGFTSVYIQALTEEADKRGLRGNVNGPDPTARDTRMEKTVVRFYRNVKITSVIPFRFYRNNANPKITSAIAQSPFGSKVGLEGVQLNNGSGFRTMHTFQNNHTEISWDDLTDEEKSVFRQRTNKQK